MADDKGKNSVRIAVVYHSTYGHTEKVAQAVKKGIESVPGVMVTLLSVDNAISNMDTLDGMDGIVFGCPTYMGGPSADFKKFADVSAKKWGEGKWKNKIAAGFSNSGSLSGDKLLTLQYLCIFAMQHGMIWVGLDEKAPNITSGHGATPSMINRLGSWLGLAVQSDNTDAIRTPSPGDIETAQKFGSRVAIATKRWAASASL